MPKKKGPVELPPVNEGVWFAGGGATVSADDEAITAYSPSGDFKTDYLAYCKIWGLTVHPQIVRSWNAIQYEADERARLEEEAKAEADRLAGIEPEEGSKKKKKKKKKKRRPERDPDAPITDADLFDMKPSSTWSVRGHKLDGNHMIAATLALPHCEKVTTIKLWNASLGEDEIRVLAAALPKCTTIKAVYLDWNPLPSRAAAPVAAIEATPGGKDEGGEGKGEEEKGGDGGDGDGDGDGDSKAQAAAPASPADVFAELINNDSSFSYLSLRGNNLSEGTAALGSALRTNTTIGALNLYSNKLGDSNVVPLLEALRDNRTLTSLSLGDNGLTSDCVSAFKANLLHYSLTEAEVEARNEFEASLDGGGAKKKKKGKGDAGGGLPPLQQVKGVWYGRGTDVLKQLDLSQNRLGSQGVANLLLGLYPAPPPPPPPAAAPPPEPEDKKGKKGKQGGKKGKAAAPPAEEKLEHVVSSLRTLDLSANAASLTDPVTVVLPELPPPPAPSGDDAGTADGDAGGAGGDGAGAGGDAGAGAAAAAAAAADAQPAAGTPPGPPTVGVCLQIVQQLASAPVSLAL